MGGSKRGFPLVSNAAAQAIDRQAVPRLKPGLDLQTLNLSQDEGFLLSRVDGTMSVDELTKILGLPDDKVMTMLAALTDQGLLELEGVAAAAGPSEADEDLGYHPKDLEEGIDITLELQKKLLRLYKARDELSHYQLLDVDRQADNKQIKRAYFKVSKDYHPDTYFRKEIGTFRAKIVALFKKVSLAYEVLSNEQKRAAYDHSLPYEPSPEEIQASERKVKLKASDDRLKAERRRRLLKRTPRAKRKAQARRHYDDAVDWKEKKNMVKAANSVRLALTLDSDNARYQALLDEVGPKASEIRADNEYKRGRYEESMGNEEGALVAYLAAIEQNPNNSRALFRAAQVMLAMKRDLKTALTFARKAEQLDPENGEVVRTTADLYYLMNMSKNALREYNRYLQINPFDERIVERVKELRKVR
jgi:curved DNA-binding protein CbpA